MPGVHQCTRAAARAFPEIEVTWPPPGDCGRYPTAAMTTPTPARFAMSILLATVPFALGCFKQTDSHVQTIERAAETALDGLPAWLQDRPDGWSDDNWHEYQTSLIELRDPIARRGEYTIKELETVTAEVEHLPGEYEDRILQEWHDKWMSRLTSYERTGGCGCCNEVYTVSGPKAAIEEFPVHRGRREYFPRYLDTKPTG
jgi:hypothetical protein